MWIAIVTVSVLASSLIYLKFFSLYHLLIAATLAWYLVRRSKNKFIDAAILNQNFHDGKTYKFYDKISLFLLVWVLYALLTVLWSPNKTLSLQYVYYIFLIFGFVIICRCELTTRNKWENFVLFLVFLTLALNLIGIWEMQTGNHIVPNYLDSADRIRLLKYMPGGPFRNPNDFATCLAMLTPYSLLAFTVVNNKAIKLVCLVNMILVMVVISGTSSRANLIALVLLYTLFALSSVKKRKGMLISIILLGTALFLIINTYIYPIGEVISKSFSTIELDSLLNSADEAGTSTSIRINLMLNALLMVRDSFGFGVGAACHRVLMQMYSVAYYNTGATLVAHNLFIEILADYGILIFSASIVMFVSIFYRLNKIKKSTEYFDQRYSASMLIIINIIFLISSLSSSSIIQLTSLWINFGITSAFFNIDWGKELEKRDITEEKQIIYDNNNSKLEVDK